MSDIKIYGIKNCDTMKKAFKWLDENSIEYVFHDYKKEGADLTALKQAIKDHDWETVINQRGTTWRQLPDDIKTAMNNENALKIAEENPSIIKRPLLIAENKSYLGFKLDTYSEIFE